MPVTKGLVFAFIPEQRLQSRHLRADPNALLQPVDHCGQGDFLCIPCLQCSTHSGEEVGIFRVHSRFLCQLQGADKGRLQLRQEVEGTA